MSLSVTSRIDWTEQRHTHRTRELLSALEQGVVKENNLIPILDKHKGHHFRLKFDQCQLLNTHTHTPRQRNECFLLRRCDLPVIWFWPFTIPIVRRTRTIVDIASKISCKCTPRRRMWSESLKMLSSAFHLHGKWNKLIKMASQMNKIFKIFHLARASCSIC